MIPALILSEEEVNEMLGVLREATKEVAPGVGQSLGCPLAQLDYTSNANFPKDRMTVDQACLHLPESISRHCSSRHWR